MKTTTLGRAAILGLIYVAAFVALVLIQFPSAGPKTETVAGISVRATPAARGEGLRTVELSAGGIRLAFSERQPLVYHDEAGTERRAQAVSYRLGASDISLSFDDSSRLTVGSGAGGKLTWTLVLPVKASSAVLRFAPARGAHVLPPSDDGSPRVGVGDAVYVLSGFRTGDELGETALSLSRGVPRAVTAIPEPKAGAGQSTQFLAQNPMEPALWTAALAAYREKAWAGLSGERFDPARAVWKTADGAERFDEGYFAAYMAEAMKRGRVEAASALAAAVRSTRLESITYLGVPFAGRTAKAMAVFEQASLAEVKEIERAVQARSPELFYRKGLVPQLFDRSPYALAQEAMGLARGLELNAATALEALRIAQAYLDARDYLPEADNPFSRAAELADRVLAPAVRKAGGDFFLETGSGGVCDLLTGVEAGFTLIELGEATGKAIYTGIGQSLVNSALALSDPYGSIPRSVTVRNGVAEPSAELSPVSAVYPLLGDSPYYPHAVSFFRELGPGAWAWTAAPVLKVVPGAGQLTYTAEYPVGASHYLAVYGVKPFGRIQLYGLNYNMDAGFEGYNASGYFFKRDSGALYVKMRHKAAREDIALFY